MNAPVVIDRDGLRAVLETPDLDQATQADLRLESGERLSVPTDFLDRRDDGTYRLAFAFQAVREGTVVIPIVEEQIAVGKRVRETGRVRIAKRVETREEVVDEPLLHEDVEVERVPIGRYVEGRVEVRHEGDTTIIPIFEEVLVVEKRLLLKEELHVTKRQTEVRDPQRITLRKEHVEVERLTSPDPSEEGRVER